MTIQATTHLNFRGDARAALEFYQSVFGGHLIANTYAAFGMPAELPEPTRSYSGSSLPRTASASWDTTFPVPQEEASSAEAPPGVRTTPP